VKLRKDRRQRLLDVATVLLRTKPMDDEFPISSVELSVSTLRQLAKAIYRVSQGEDARSVFKQGRRYQSKLDTVHRHRGIAYKYFELQVMHGKSEPEAAKLVASECRLKASSVAKTMRPYREVVLNSISMRHEFDLLTKDGCVVDEDTRGALLADACVRVAEFRNRTEPYAKDYRSQVGKKQT
jgi:hypothetical protein